MHQRRNRSQTTAIALAILGAPAAFAAACGNDGGHAGAPASNDASTTPEAGVGDAFYYERMAYDGIATPVAPRVPVHAEVTSNRVDTQSLMFAGGEMQISGEPFASGFAGRNLADYDRTYLPTDQYILDNGGTNPVPLTDLFGFSTAVESYEYSKYYMNLEIQQTTAGVSLADGPVVANEPGTTTLDKLRARMFDLLSNAGTDVGGYATLPAPTSNNQNYLGFPGQWPAFLPFRSWDPTLTPTLSVVRSCTYQGGYGGLGFGTTVDPLYECAYNSLHLPNRDTAGREGPRSGGAGVGGVEAGAVGHRLRRTHSR